jgi:hypothetical protein
MGTRSVLLVRFVAIAALCALCWVPVHAAEEAPPAPRPPRTLGEMAKRIGDLDQRVTALLALANKDPDERWIDIYKHYSAQEYKKTRGRVTAKDVAGWMADPTKNFNVRQKAKEALIKGKWKQDPDLSNTEKRGTRTHRANFCWDVLLDYLRSRRGKPTDRLARAMAAEVLNAYYPQAKQSSPEIAAYNPDAEGTWNRAWKAWRKYLYKR